VQHTKPGDRVGRRRGPRSAPGRYPLDATSCRAAGAPGLRTVAAPALRLLPRAVELTLTVRVAIARGGPRLSGTRRSRGWRQVLQQRAQGFGLGRRPGAQVESESGTAAVIHAQRFGDLALAVQAVHQAEIE